MKSERDMGSFSKGSSKTFPATFYLSSRYNLSFSAPFPLLSDMRGGRGLSLPRLSGVGGDGEWQTLSCLKIFIHICNEAEILDARLLV